MKLGKVRRRTRDFFETPSEHARRLAAKSTRIYRCSGALLFAGLVFMPSGLASQLTGILPAGIGAFLLGLAFLFWARRVDKHRRPPRGFS